MNEDSSLLESDITLIQRDTTETKSPFINNESSATPCKVLGRKINSAAMLSNNAESIYRYPIPVKISFCKPKRLPKRQFQDISNRPNSQLQRQVLKSKTPEPGKVQKQADAKKSAVPKLAKATTKALNTKPQQKKTKISIEIPLSLNENSVGKKNINSIVMQTLKKQKIQKKKEEEWKNEEKFRQVQIKRQLAELNKNTRMGNLSKFKQEKFQPVCPWGTDERRITRVNDAKILKEADELRKKKREERERSKSAGKSRIGLDVIKLKKEASRFEEEELPERKKYREKNRSVLEFMKKQKILRQKSKEMQMEKAREEENKRLQQLLELEKITRGYPVAKSYPKRAKSQKSKKEHKKQASESFEGSETVNSEDDEVMNILHGVRSVTPDTYEIHPNISSFDYSQNGRECMVFGVFPENSVQRKGNVTQLVNDIVEKRNRFEEKIPAASATMPLAEVKSSCSVLNTEDEYRETVGSDISKRKEEIRKKLSELRHRVDRSKKHESQDYDEKFRAATKIQAWVRGWLTRVAIQRYLQQEESENWLYHQGRYSESYESRVDAEETDSLTEVPQEKSRKKQLEIEVILKTQAEWREIQKQKLRVLKNKDLEDLKILAEKVGSEEFLMSYFEEIIERRYGLIEQLFDENIEAVKTAVRQAIEDGDRESLMQTLENQENFASEIFQNLENNEEADDYMRMKQQFDFKNIWIYSDNDEQSIRISELEFQSPSARTHSEKRGSQKSENSGFSDSFEDIQKNIRFAKKALKMLPIAPCFEPVAAVFDSDVLGILGDLVGQETYLECLEEAWDEILTSTVFINSAAEVLLKNLLLSETNYIFSMNIPMDVLKGKPVPALNLNSIKKKGIQMDENFILSYIKQLFDYLQCAKYDIEAILNTPNTLGPIDLLAKMQESEIGVVIEKNLQNRVLPLHLYIELENDTTDSTSLQELQHIHNKLLFDVVNELLHKRCKISEPMPWSFELKVFPQKTVYLNSILGSLIEEIKEINKTQAGKTPKVEFISNSQDSEEDIVSQIREEQLSAILASEINNQEFGWINYEFEETQVKLDLSDMTLEDLVEELVSILSVN